VPGASLAIVTRDRVLFADGIGMAGPAANRPATVRRGSFSESLPCSCSLRSDAKPLETEPMRNNVPAPGTVTAWSVSILALTTLFPALTLASLVQVWRARRWKIRREVYWLSLWTALACAAVALYLGYWGRVVFRTWS
jgi:hypothetical protein